jgi:DNA processing protein
MEQASAGIPEERIIAWLRLARVPNIGPVLVKRAVAALGSPEAVLAAHPPVLAAIEGIGTMRAQAFVGALSRDEARRELDTVRGHGLELLCRDDPRWPAGLKAIDDPPIVLYLRGTLIAQDNLAVGIVGARQCTMYGREQAGRFGALLAQAGFTVISGGARGIDTAAHEGALRNKGRTIVIQGCGALNCYPPENAALYERIVAAGGAILTELPLDAPPAKENFPPRNRIIAGMSLGILVVEANLRSGSLITARLAAADYGREVFALPGRVDSPASAGTHHLIKSATAHLVESVEDILDALGDVGTAIRQIQQAGPGKAAGETGATTGPQASLFAGPVTDRPAAAEASAGSDSAPRFTGVQQKILAALDGEAASVDDLVERTGLPASVLMAELTMLQIRAVLSRAPGNRFAKRSS